MNRTYIITSKKVTGDLKLGYNAEGNLVSMDIGMEWTPEQFTWFYGHLPITYGHLEAMVKLSKSMTLKELAPDLSFEVFWNAYGYKIGNKLRAQKLWNDLPDGERMEAIDKIKSYNGWLKRHLSTERLYPETYLNQKRYQVNYNAN